MKIMFLDNRPEYGMNTTVHKEVCDKYGIEYEALNCASEDDVIEKCRDADGILDVYIKITPRIIDALPKCKVMVRTGVGYDCIDVDACSKKGVFVCNVPDYCFEEVATHTVALILDICRKTTFYSNEAKKGKWSTPNGYPMKRLSKQTVGFVGFGNIARQAARYISAFGSRIIAYDPYLPASVFSEYSATSVSLDELLAQSDIISLHTPLFDSTRHIINKDSIAKMKDGVFIVNTSRGPLICEKDLMEAVESGKVAAAGLDVIEFEPLSGPDHPYFKTGRIVLTPHSAYSSEDSNVELSRKAAEKACQILTGDFNESLLRCIVNRKQLEDKIPK